MFVAHKFHDARFCSRSPRQFDFLNPTWSAPLPELPELPSIPTLGVGTDGAQTEYIIPKINHLCPSVSPDFFALLEPVENELVLHLHLLNFVLSKEFLEMFYYYLDMSQ